AKWVDPAVEPHLLRAIDGSGFARADDWTAGAVMPVPEADLARVTAIPRSKGSPDLLAILEKAKQGATGLVEKEIVRLLKARGDDFTLVCQAADQLRAKVAGDEVTYCVNRNINYTNVCYFKCQFCAFSKGKMSENLRGRPYDLTHEEIMRRTREAWARGASEVCLQGGIHPEYTGQTYIDICHSIKQAVPDVHIHAFSPLEVWQGAKTLGKPIPEFLRELKEAGLGTLPGTAAEILDDEVRATLCPDKINTSQWLEVMEAAHGEGFNTTATIMYGHLEEYRHVARHLLRVRNLQAKTGGFTEFVILPFIHEEAPLYLKGMARKGPSFREAVLIHAVARLALHPHFRNIHASWTKLGHDGVKACLQAGVNDIGGTLMNETITRAAGAAHGQETSPEEMEQIISSLGRSPRQRSTTYGEPPDLQRQRSFGAVELVEPIYTSAKKYDRKQSKHKRELVRSSVSEKSGDEEVIASQDII
ncbi:MAG: 5-amino-6-(D-ribitylamino)uracil--L-tyrosine 4-hydroxyphenyl transferase CofH, partial [Pseudomonadales bacterium]